MALKFHNRKVRDIPFVDRIDIDIISPSTVRVNIKEKPLDGCIYYKKKNVYFSKEGMIETVSGRDIENVTRINGVVLTHSTEGKQVLAKNQLGLDLSLSLLREMDKYGIHADSIEVDDRSAITAVFGDVRVKLGKSGFEQTPVDLEDAAKIDGANDLVIFLRVMLPLQGPLLATFTLFTAVAYWNEWFWSMLLINSASKMTLQTVLRSIVAEAAAAADVSTGEADLDVFSQGVKMAAVMMAMVPIMCFYPFLQKYFVKGVMVGSVKM